MTRLLLLKIAGVLILLFTILFGWACLMMRRSETYDLED